MAVVKISPIALRSQGREGKEVDGIDDPEWLESLQGGCSMWWRC